MLDLRSIMLNFIANEEAWLGVESVLICSQARGKPTAADLAPYVKRYETLQHARALIELAPQGIWRDFTDAPEHDPITPETALLRARDAIDDERWTSAYWLIEAVLHFTLPGHVASPHRRDFSHAVGRARASLDRAMQDDDAAQAGQTARTCIDNALRLLQMLEQTNAE